MAYLLEKILDFGIIGGGFVGLIGIFFPEFLYKFANPVSETPYNEKDALIGSGSGFFISENGLAITKYHVIRKKYKTDPG